MARRNAPAYRPAACTDNAPARAWHTASGGGRHAAQSGEPGLRHPAHDAGKSASNHPSTTIGSPIATKASRGKGRRTGRAPSGMEPPLIV
jgi:hypothetical protein